jgi:ribosomal protein L16 Arg81 hydroxylase
MDCRFLENFSFASLIAPVSEEEFQAHYWEQQPLIVHRTDSDYYGNLFTLQDLDDAVMRSPDYVKLSDAVTKMSTSYVGPTVPGLEKILADLREGGTLVMDHLELREPKLGLICRLLAQELGHRFQTNLYLTPPRGRGSIPHWDNHDVFILQVMGSKRWTIEKERRTFPGKGDKMASAGRDFRGELNSFTVNRGDLIYIPRGFMHAAECEATPSLHITIGVVAFFLEDMLNAVLRAAIQRDERLRRALPLRFMNGGRESLIANVRTSLREVEDENLLGAVVDQYRDELIKSFLLDVSGQIVDIFRPKALESGDLVGSRRGIVYRLHVADDTLRINVGTRTIVLPGFFREAVDFALRTPAFAIYELPGELDDDEKLVFIERLIQEGLVIRK